MKDGGDGGPLRARLQDSPISTDIVRNAPPYGRTGARARTGLALVRMHRRSRGGAACLRHFWPAGRVQPGARTVREIGAIGRARVDDPHDRPDVRFVDADAAATRQQTIREQSKDAHPAPPGKWPARVYALTRRLGTPQAMQMLRLHTSSWIVGVETVELRRILSRVAPARMAASGASPTPARCA